ncbi:uncharacterized protein [Drosophila tropicalis]|uniref:uncharacterized protein n=1 Tax=Drosophila tropicalis TaxID=46794 RepID=UPI0035AC2890
MSKRNREGIDGELRKQARQRFKRLVRTVVLNMRWLNEANDESGLSLNVKRNVAMLVRQKRKVGMMTMAEKSLLRTPHFARTVEDRKKLCSIVANLECFNKLPPKIRARLVPFVTFMAVNSGRNIMKEGDYPITLYFIINGEVEMSKNILNRITKKYEAKTESLFGPGDCIGDVDLFEDAPRTNTYTATSNCELLAVYESDYNRLLKPYLLKQWAEKKTALRALDYFNYFNDEQIVNACKYGSIQQFDPLETIYTEDKGFMSYVYFVLSGECAMLQCLYMKITYIGREKQFELTSVSRRESVDNVLSEEAKKHMRMSVKPVTKHDATKAMQSSSSSDNMDKKSKTLRKMTFREIERACDMWLKPVDEPTENKKKRQSNVFNAMHKALGGDDQQFDYLDEDEYSYGERVGADDDDDDDDDDEYERIIETDSTRNEPEPEWEQQPGVGFADSEIPTTSSSGSRFSTTSSDSVMAKPKKTTSMPRRDQFETHFIDIGSLTYGGIFGLGEKMDHRVIMARTTVQCLILPRFWLFEERQNPGNIWQRQRFYINCNIPSREALFSDFIKTRKWDKFRSDYVHSQLNQESLANSTKVEDIPIISRIVQTTDEL